MLTRRQMEVMELASQGLINRDIGERLGIDEETVRSHVQNVCKSLNTHSKMQAVIELVRTKQLVWDERREQLVVSRNLYGKR